MARRNKEQTGDAAASAAARVLRGKGTKKDAKTAAASALTQKAGKGRKKKRGTSEHPSPGEMLRGARERRGIGQRQMAKDLGLTCGHISRLESDQRVPSVYLALLVCSYLGYPVEVVFGAYAEEIAKRRLAGKKD